MIQITILVLFNIGFLLWTRNDIRPPHRWAVIPTHKLRILRAMVSSQIVMWSLLSIWSLIHLAYVDFGSLGLDPRSQLLGVMPLGASILAAIQVRQLFRLRSLYTARMIEGPAQVETSHRFKELLEAFQTNPSPQLLEALLREIGPPPKSWKFFGRGRPDTGFDL